MGRRGANSSNDYDTSEIFLKEKGKCKFQICYNKNFRQYDDVEACFEISRDDEPINNTLLYFRHYSEIILSHYRSL